MHLLNDVRDGATAVREEDGIDVVASPCSVGDRLEAIMGAIAHVEVCAEAAREARGRGESAAAIGDACVASVELTREDGLRREEGLGGWARYDA